MRRGDRILHSIYGPGVIQKILGEEKSALFEIRFDTGSVQRLHINDKWKVEETEKTMSTPERAKCVICGFDANDEDEGYCDRCIEQVGTVGIAILVARNSNQLAHIWALARKVLSQPPDEYAASLNNCRACNGLVAVSARESIITPGAAQFCSRECAAKGERKHA